MDHDMESATSKSTPEDNGVVRKHSSCPESARRTGLLENSGSTDNTSQGCSTVGNTSTFSKRENPESKSGGYKDGLLRYRAWRRIKIAGLVAVTVTVWGLLLLPVVIFNIPTVSIA